MTSLHKMNYIYNDIDCPRYLFASLLCLRMHMTFLLQRNSNINSYLIVDLLLFCFLSNSSNTKAILFNHFFSTLSSFILPGFASCFTVMLTSFSAFILVLSTRASIFCLSFPIVCSRCCPFS